MTEDNIFDISKVRIFKKEIEKKKMGDVSRVEDCRIFFHDDRRLPCELNISCTSTIAESKAKIWYQ